MPRILIASILPLALIALMEMTILKTLSALPYWCMVVYIVIATLGYIGALLAITLRGARPIYRPWISNFLVGWSFVALVQKIVLLLLLFVVMLGTMLLSGASVEIAKFIAFGISLIVVAAMVYGITYGKYRYVVEKQEVFFHDLPKSMDGLKVVHISDIHSGTWDSIAGVQKGIDLIQAQEPDLILFTGDLVNISKDEIDPFIHLFKSLQATQGKYAVLGNHDYFGQPRERSLRPAYYEDLYSKFDQMDFDLILNDSRSIDIGEDRMFIAGVENWGHSRYFPKRGDLDKAFANVPDDAFTILMSHDPSHWDLHVKIYDRVIPLTLSGHTHGMQFGINLPFFKWSPVQYRYKQWMGLYNSHGRQLYVNRGFGLLAYPGRVGMSPEVTVLELKCGAGSFKL